MEAPRSRKSKSRSSSSAKKSNKKSGVRTKFLIESLRNDYYALREENDRLRSLVTANLPEDAAQTVLADCFDPSQPREKVGNIDELAEKMAGSNIEEEDDDDDAVGY